MTSEAILPIATVQPTFPEVIDDVQSGRLPSDSFWISCYKAGEESVHAKVHVALSEEDRDRVDFEVKDGDVRFEYHNRMYSVTCPSLAIPSTRVLLPKQEYGDPEHANLQHPHKIAAFDVSPDRTLFATAFLDGSIHLYPSLSATSPTSKRTTKPHLSTVTSLRFFPSSRVLLSAGADFSLSILPADPFGPSPSPQTERITPARVLRAHTRSITSTSIISRGRNVLSGSKDGTIRLWDVSAGETIRTWVGGGGRYVPVNALCLGESPSGQRGANGHTDIEPREIDADGKLAFAGLHDGSFEIFDLRSPDAIFRSAPGRAPLNVVAYDSTTWLLASGTTRGGVAVYDMRFLSSLSSFGSEPTVLVGWRRNSASIEDLSWLPSAAASHQLAIATEDGLPYIASIDQDGGGVEVQVKAEVVGGDCDAVRAVRFVGDEMWTAGDDGVVRRYGL